MRYDVHVADGSRFELERDDDDPLVEGDFLRQFTMIYRVKRIIPTDPTDENFDAVAEVDWAAGPAQAEYLGAS